MAKCQFCKREFSNAQGVRAHLKHCPFYQGRREAPKSVPTRSRRQDSPEAHFHRLLKDARHSQGGRVYSPQSSSYPKEQNVARSIQPQDSSPLHRLPPDRKADDIRRDQLRKEEERRKQVVQQQQEQRKRQLVQQVKINVVDCFWQWPEVPIEAKVKAKLAIERKLLTLPILDLPFFEILQIGQALRDSVYGKFRQNQSTHNIHPQKKELNMPITKLLSGLFDCPSCGDEFALDLTPEKKARCPACHVALEEIEDSGYLEDDQSED